MLRAAGADIDTTDFDLGGGRYLRDGEVLSEATIEQLREFDAILFGAAGRPDVTPGILERGLIVGMRIAFDLYINERPFQGTAPGHDASRTTSSSSARTPRARTSATVDSSARERSTRWRPRAR